MTVGPVLLSLNTDQDGDWAYFVSLLFLLPTASDD